MRRRQTLLGGHVPNDTLFPTLQFEPLMSVNAPFALLVVVVKHGV